ncbi:MAG: hypothetical protein ACOC5A_01710 [Halanaerobiales bacterium]
MKKMAKICITLILVLVVAGGVLQAEEGLEADRRELSSLVDELAEDENQDLIQEICEKNVELVADYPD